MKQFFTFLAAVLLTATSVAQVGINTDNPYPLAALDIVSTTGGLLPPRMTKAQRNQINVNDPAFPADGLMIYQTDGTAGFYYYNGSSWSEVGAIEKTYTINTFYAELGGYVIEINTDGTHGLVAAMQDQGTSNWYEANDLLSNAANHDVNGAKFKDWRLPTKRELNLMYVQRTNIGATSFYWSSTEGVTNYAWTQSFNDGIQFYYDKVYSNAVRAVRAF